MNNLDNDLKTPSSNYLAINLANDYKKMIFSNITNKIFRLLFKILLATLILCTLKFLL